MVKSLPVPENETPATSLLEMTLFDIVVEDESTMHIPFLELLKVDDLTFMFCELLILSALFAFNAVTFSTRQFLEFSILIASEYPILVILQFLISTLSAATSIP